MNKPKLTIGVTGLNAIDSPGPGVAVIRGLKEAVSFDCRIAEVVERGTHSVLFCEVEAVRQGAATRGLIWFSRDYHGVGAG